ncbi:MAG: hypothetical protein A2600_07900 [Candidatus Lambdaproteobacteria bacterium RIFOXYD1_FULL_56_27]|uniref:Uncharacterized protein n=1 Tax=Candidatus Lambdaproteobacteria bacterium RIFOXYD2_FULL_56_26 TaxID=1817773 RepID=A0A1F6GNR2_9PROT|nr:MAG: hypothetical protein A2557_06120 [Candidatus Lambdaproteobacteria bacterium RIFOXYD2_FULL_56_26]OGG99881.1 MAG: hypothetical protein A2426_09855 [Candidatus Lambdaproteobacteria bacterium RIFOXYC1_FULL_56_13]OGH09696.1 MAG: hypothetical protein A2600_07900 [Candidatus Lambdaproteobacteria bacterium RIFOXYD1_FULL_56_27]
MISATGYGKAQGTSVRIVGGLDWLLVWLVGLYSVLYPPFVSHVWFESLYRLTVEGLLLAFLTLVYLGTRGGRFAVTFLTALVLVSLYGMFSGEALAQVFSFLNKLLFLMLLYRVARDRPRFARYLRQGWVWFWVLTFLLALTAFTTKFLGLLRFGPFPFPVHYPYQFHPLLGNLLDKNLGGVMFPRVCGFFDEPGLLAFFAGLNFYIGPRLFESKIRGRWFSVLALAAGLTTLSYTLFIFLAVWFVLKVTKLLDYKVEFTLLLLGIGLVSVLTFVLLVQNIDLLPNSSGIDRLKRMLHVWEEYKALNFYQILFGTGILPLKAILSGGANAGLLQVFIARGLLLSLFFFGVILKLLDQRKTLTLYVLYFSLAFDFFWYPLFLTGLVVSFFAVPPLSAQPKPGSPLTPRF